MIGAEMSDDTASAPLAAAPAAGNGAAYRVLARKYRPATFAEVIGQEALVRTLTNAIAAGRLAHAFILTGVRGVGKTTTARIIARALNCLGADGSLTGPTVTPCGVCESCRTIAADRHVDVMEMDAASRTGVDDIREIIDGVRYGPVQARYKVYIIDEVHMLSKNAFNALLKTLEEPPPHTKFIFATTEIRKVPVTVLSRCQRFDLRRVEVEELAGHFAGIAAKEGVAVEPEAIAMIARAADGSVRDGLSLLDQAMAQSGGGTIAAAQVRDMLGLADRIAVIDLFEAAVTGKGPETLDRLGEMHRAGADPLVILQDLLDFTHFLTRLQVVPKLAEDPGIPEADRRRGGALARALSIPVLTRTWQILLKGLGEVQQAPAPEAALEMVLIRLIHSAGLPTPAEVIRKLESGGYGAFDPAPAGPAPGGGFRAPGPSGEGGPPVSAGPVVRHSGQEGGQRMARGDGSLKLVAPAEPAGPEPVPADFRGLVALFERRSNDPQIYGHLSASVHLVRYQPGLLEFRPTAMAPKTLAAQIMAQLQQWTGQRWVVSVSREPGEPTLSEQDRAAERLAHAEAIRHPLVQAVLEAFPGAIIRQIRDLTESLAGPGEADAAPAPFDPNELGPDDAGPEDSGDE